MPTDGDVMTLCKPLLVVIIADLGRKPEKKESSIDAMLCYAADEGCSKQIRNSKIIGVRR
jgi:hypothetical protein